MTVTVLVEESNGQFCATLAGSPELRAVRPTRAEAIAVLQSELAAKAAVGELVNIQLDPLGVSSLAGIFRDDPSLTEICDDIYRLRDLDRPQ